MNQTWQTLFCPPRSVAREKPLEAVAPRSAPCYSGHGPEGPAGGGVCHEFWWGVFTTLGITPLMGGRLGEQILGREEQFRRELYQILGEVNHLYDDPSDGALVSLMTVTTYDPGMDECQWQLYRSHINIEIEYLENCVRWCKGADLMNIRCDCDQDSQDLCEYSTLSMERSYHYQLGQESKANNDRGYNWCLEFRKDLKKRLGF